MQSPIVIPSSPEQTPTHSARCALSVIVLSSDDETLSPIKTAGILPKQIVSTESSSDDDLILVNIIKDRHERAEILNEPNEETIQVVTPGVELTTNDKNNLDNLLNGHTSKYDQKKIEKLKIKNAKELLKESQKNIKKVNIKRDKNTTAKEIVVEISTDLMDRNGEELVALLQEIEIECVYSSNPVPCSLLLKRKVDRTWNENNACWMPCTAFLERESFVILQLDGFEFADAVKQGINDYHQRIKSNFPSFKIIYIIQDLDAYYSEKKKKLHRQMQENLSEGEAPNRLSKKAREREKFLDTLPQESVIEEQILWLQLQSKGDIFIHFSKKNETASWIKTFIVEIGHIPEWKSRNEESFNVQFGDSIKSGKNLKDTWQKMLECIPFVTESKALAILEKYPTFNSLYSAYSSMNIKDGEALLTGINLGNTVSKRVYDAFMSKATQSKLRK